jgi:AcrR family transcriptional regulator
VLFETHPKQPEAKTFPAVAFTDKADSAAPSAADIAATTSQFHVVLTATLRINVDFSSGIGYIDSSCSPVYARSFPSVMSVFLLYNPAIVCHNKIPNWGRCILETKKMDRRVRKTRMQLRAGLTQLMKEKPIKDITVRELAQLVDINRCTFYLHYRDIYDMVAHVEQEVFSEFEALVEKYPPLEIQNKPLPMLLDLYTYFADNSDLCTVFLSGNGDITFVNKLIGLIRDRVLEYWLQERNLDAEHFDYYFSFIATGCIGIIREWFLRDMHESTAEMARITEQMILHGATAVSKES